VTAAQHTGVRLGTVELMRAGTATFVPAKVGDTVAQNTEYPQDLEVPSLLSWEALLLPYAL